MKICKISFKKSENQKQQEKNLLSIKRIVWRSPKALVLVAA
jgi:hypothetical protein